MIFFLFSYFIASSSTTVITANIGLPGSSHYCIQPGKRVCRTRWCRSSPNLESGGAFNLALVIPSPENPGQCSSLFKWV